MTNVIRGMLAVWLLVSSWAILAMPAMADDRFQCWKGVAQGLRADEVIAACTRLIEKERLSKKDRAIVYANRCAIYNRKGLYDLAVADCSKAIKLDPRVGWFYSNRSTPYLAQGHPELALADAEEAIKLGGSTAAMAYVTRGNALAKLERYEQALSDFNKAVDLDPNDPRTFWFRASFEFQRGMYEAAISDYTETISREPSYTIVYAYRGRSYYQLNRLEEAEADLNRAIVYDRANADAYWWRGWLYQYIGKTEQAITDYRKVTALAPGYAPAHERLCNLSAARGEWPLALVECEQQIKLNPTAKAYNNRAWAFFKIGSAEAGLPDVTEALKLDPDNALTIDTRAHIYEAMGRINEAIADYKRALELDPSLSESKEGLARLTADK